MGTWMKTLQDENRTLKRRVEELEIRVKKLNDYGPTPIALAKRHATPGDSPQIDAAKKTPPRLTKAQVKKIRTARGLSQAQFAQMLGVSYFRYNKWERGKTAVPPDSEQRIIEIKGMKASDLRTCMQNVGIFQPNGKLQTVAKKTDVEAIPQLFNRNNATGKIGVPVSLPASASPQINGEAVLSAEEIRRVRTELGMSRKETAEALGIKESRYKNWEYGMAKVPARFSRMILTLRTSERQKDETGPRPPAAGKKAADPRKRPSAAAAEEMKGIRAAFGVSKRQMAELIGTHENSYGGWERGSRAIPAAWIDKIKSLRDLTSVQRKAMLREAGIELPAPKRAKTPHRKIEGAK